MTNSDAGKFCLMCSMEKEFRHEKERIEECEARKQRRQTLVGTQIPDMGFAAAVEEHFNMQMAKTVPPLKLPNPFGLKVDISQVRENDSDHYEYQYSKESKLIYDCEGIQEESKVMVPKLRQTISPLINSQRKKSSMYKAMSFELARTPSKHED